VAYVWERPGTAEELAKNPPSQADMLFDRLDGNGDDVVTADELPERLKPLLTAVVGKVPEKMTREEFAKIYEELRKRMPKKPADGEKKPADGEKKPADGKGVRLDYRSEQFASADAAAHNGFPKSKAPQRRRAAELHRSAAGRSGLIS
jgi:hypothetical protein